MVSMRSSVQFRLWALSKKGLAREKGYDIIRELILRGGKRNGKGEI